MKQNPKNQEIWLDLSDAAAFLGVHFTTLRRWADAGQIAYLRTPGGRRRFSQRALEEFLNRLSVSVESQSETTATELVVLQPMQERAISHTRKNILTINSSENWMVRLNDDQRMALRSTGRHLMVLLLQYNSRLEGGEVFLEEGKRIAHDYSQVCARVGLSLQETVGIFLFFRRSILDSIHETDHLELPVDQDSLRVFQRSNDFLDGLLLELIRNFPGSTPGNSI